MQLDGQSLLDAIIIFLRNTTQHRIFLRNTSHIGSLPIKTNAQLSQEERGAMDGCASEDKKMGLVRWNDNSVVTVISSAYNWENEQGSVTRYKSAKEYMQIPCPLPILEYNKSMGGVDKLNFLISLYRIHIKSKKWTFSSVRVEEDTSDSEALSDRE